MLRMRFATQTTPPPAAPRLAEPKGGRPRASNLAAY